MIQRCTVRYLARLATFVLLAYASDSSQAADSLHVANVRFTVANNEVRVTYDFIAPQGIKHMRATSEVDGATKYEITLILKKEQDPNFSYVPVKVRGDIGKGITPGMDKRISWNLSQEFPEGLRGDDFYFVILADPILEKDNTLLWVGATVAVLGGTLASILFLHSGGGAATKAGFPEPPRRPQ